MTINMNVSFTIQLTWSHLIYTHIVYVYLFIQKWCDIAAVEIVIVVLG